MTLKKQFKIVISLVFLISAVELVNILSNRSLNHYGLIPRNPQGLVGILTAPWLHGSIWHYFSNILPFALFSFLLLQYGTKRYVQVSIICTLCSGLLVWIFARSAIHVGASGLIYGYFGYLVLAGFFSKKFKLIFISLFVGITYGTLIFGVVPTHSYISWESHLFGLVSGLVCAWRLRK